MNKSKKNNLRFYLSMYIRSCYGKRDVALLCIISYFNILPFRIYIYNYMLYYVKVARKYQNFDFEN